MHADNCHQYAIESPDYCLENRNKNKIVHRCLDDNSGPCSLKEQVCDPDLYSCIGHVNNFGNISNDNHVSCGFCICVVGHNGNELFFLKVSCFKMNSVIMAAGAPYKIVSIFFTKVTEIFLLSGLFIKVVAGTGIFLFLGSITFGGSVFFSVCFLVLLFFFEHTFGLMDLEKIEKIFICHSNDLPIVQQTHFDAHKK